MSTQTIVLMKIIERKPEGRILVELIPDDAQVHLEEGDQFLTATFGINPFVEES
jgi:hypothetical protein